MFSRRHYILLCEKGDSFLTRTAKKQLRSHGFLLLKVQQNSQVLRRINYTNAVACLIPVTGNEEWADLTSSIRSEHAMLPLLHITDAWRIEQLAISVETGADDYISRPFSPTEIVLRIRRAIKRVSVCIHAEDVIRLGAYTFYPEKSLLSGPYDNVYLTYFERRILEKLADNRNCVVSRKSIIEWVGKNATGNSLSVYIHRLRRYFIKTDINIETVKGLGYMLTIGPYEE